jgi:hypothetical protein
MDTEPVTTRYEPRGTERVRPPRSPRGARPGGFRRSVLVALAIAIAVLAVMAARARAQPAGNSATRSATSRLAVGRARPDVLARVGPPA